MKAHPTDRDSPPSSYWEQFNDSEELCYQCNKSALLTFWKPTGTYLCDECIEMDKKLIEQEKVN